VIKYSLLATVIAFISILISMFVFEAFDALSSIICASITALIMIEIWGRTKKRLPTAREKSLFLLSYWALMLLLFMLPSTFAFYNAWGWLHMVVLATTYPLFMLMLFTDKQLARHVYKEVPDDD